MGNENLESISVIVAARNEERGLEKTVAEVTEAARDVFSDYEILIIDDGSSDQTPVIADRLAEKDPHIRVTHHRPARCLGGVYKSGLQQARMRYVALVNGKHDTTAAELRKVWNLRGKADIVIPYSADASYRPLSRRMVSKLFTATINTLFGLHVRYYNHCVLHRRDLISTIRIRSNSYAYQAEALVKMLRSGYTYVEVAHNDLSLEEGPTKAFFPGNLLRVAAFFTWMIYDIHLTRRYRPGRSRP